MQLLFTPSIQDDKCAFLQEAARRARSNARAGPRYDDNLVFESIHDFSDEFYERSERQWAIDLGQKNHCALVG
jgi:hypothetical protein